MGRGAPLAARARRRCGVGVGGARRRRAVRAQGAWGGGREGEGSLSGSRGTATSRVCATRACAARGVSWTESERGASARATFSSRRPAFPSLQLAHYSLRIGSRSLCLANLLLRCSTSVLEGGGSAGTCATAFDCVQLALFSICPALDDARLALHPCLNSFTRARGGLRRHALERDDTRVDALEPLEVPGEDLARQGRERVRVKQACVQNVVRTSGSCSGTNGRDEREGEDGPARTTRLSGTPWTIEYSDLCVNPASALHVRVGSTGGGD